MFNPDKSYFNPDKSYSVLVWDMPVAVWDDDADDYIRNEDGTVKLFNIRWSRCR